MNWLDYFILLSYYYYSTLNRIYLLLLSCTPTTYYSILLTTYYNLLLLLLTTSSSSSSSSYSYSYLLLWWLAAAYYSTYLLLTPTTTLPTIVVAGLFWNCLFSNFVAFAIMNFCKLLNKCAEVVAYAMMWNFLCWGSGYDDEMSPYLWAAKLGWLVYHIQATSLEAMWLQWGKSEPNM
jgi:hypothetical protein